MSFADSATPESSAGVDLAVVSRLLSWERTAPRTLVHRQSVHEVLLTDSRTLPDGRIAVGVQFPRWHAVSAGGPAEVLADTLAVEAIRQIGLMLAHTEMAVELAAVFLARELGYQRLAPPTVFADSVVAAVGVARLRRDGRGKHPAFALDVDLLVGNVVVGVGVGRMTCVPQAVYRRLRGAPRLTSAALGSSPATPGVAPARVGRRLDRQVVLTRDEATGEIRLRVDPGNPFCFDHPYDHVPGTLLIEAMQQAVAFATGAATAGAHATFHRYVELCEPVTLSTSADGAPAGAEAGAREVVVRQGDVTVATGVVYVDDGR